jgi:hypothetical protein
LRKLPTKPLTLLGPAELDEIERIARGLGVNDFDVIVAGDGSGSLHTNPCGWASVLVDRRRLDGGYRAFYGAVDAGSISFAEILPYAHALDWYQSNVPDRPAMPRVIVITDSEYVAKTGEAIITGRPMESVKHHSALWSAFLEFARLGMRIQFLHSKRATSALNIFADDVSRRSRIHLAAANPKNPEAAAAALKPVARMINMNII